jgi:bifunctional DNA-binding transcriptional regulator/antitoxin component of YhaV-PrlF toxin-antitoxin module
MAEKHSVVATVSRGGRLRIPREVLERLHLKDGAQIVFFLREDMLATLVAPVASAVQAPDPKWN